MPIYQTKGQLTGVIESENLAVAQAYLSDDDMAKYVDEDLQGALERIEWRLGSDGYHYRVEAVAKRELTDAEQGKLSEWVSGQNSDGLGEGFEQQPFAETAADYEDEEDEVGMISFDWRDNEYPWERVA